MRLVPAGIQRPPYADSGKLPGVDRKPQVHNAQVKAVTGHKRASRGVCPVHVGTQQQADSLPGEAQAVCVAQHITSKHPGLPSMKEKLQLLRLHHL